jgi:steroid 5-alpha reductase family enzyme
MRKIILGIIVGAGVIACPFLYAYLGPTLSEQQLQIFSVLLTIAGGSALYCFLVGEITHNNSQMDKLWSLLPPAYLWVIAGMGGWNPRLLLMAILVSLWGIRLTFNFARKGAYLLKFWTGKEDYRWEVLRAKKSFQPRYKWVLFDFFFISVYQNALVLLITLPALLAVGSTSSLNWVDYLAAGLLLFFLAYETVADEEQWRFQSQKWAMLHSGKALEELPAPYNKGFNTVGLWSRSRHPNYFGEQGIWVSFYLFSIAAIAMNDPRYLFNWSLAGALLLIALFLGSSTFAEAISSSKYPGYAHYQKSVFSYLPFRKYRD